MNLIQNFKSRMATLRSALLFAAIGTGVLALGVGLIWRVLQRDNVAFVQQSIGDTSSMLALQVKLEVERLELVLQEIGHEKLKPHIEQPQSEVTIIAENASSPVNAALAEAATVIAAADTTGTIETEPEVSEVSLWKREGTQQPAVRAYLAVNSRFSEAFPQHLARIQELEGADRERIEPAFHGHALILAEPFPGLAKPIVLMVLPLGHGEVSEVVAAHVSFEKVQKLFSMDGLVQSELVDHEGVTLAHPDVARFGRKENEAGRPLAPLFDHIAQPSSVESGLQELKDAKGKIFYGGFRQITRMGLAVLSSVPGDQASASLDSLRAQLVAYIFLVFVALFSGRWLLLVRKKPAGFSPPVPAQELAAGPSLVAQLSEAESIEQQVAAAMSGVVPAAPKKIAIVALHGSLRGFNQLLEGAGAEETTEALNDYFLAVASIVRRSGGRFECYPGASFAASWELVDGASATALTQAVICGLSVRAEMERLNQSRKLDGKKPLKQGMGLHVGQALFARLGVVPELRECVTGEALACARALDRLALAEGKDFLISQEALKAARAVFVGKSLGEAKLTADTGLTPYIAVISYREDASLQEGVLEAGTFGGQDPGAVSPDERLTGGETRVQIVRGEEAVQRWLVNNGSQIVGPFTAQQLSKMLYMQELDFDCECWHESTGRSSSIATAGIFSGSEDADASYWVYDGELLHGPVSQGFIKTALQHGAFTESAAVCQGSTIAGWKKMTQLAAEITDRKPGTDSGPAAA